MPAQRYTLAYHHDNMVPAPEGKSYVQTVWDTEDGITLCYGNTVPTDATEGYAPGCIFQHVDGSGLVDVLYLNVGTYASCNFDSVAGFAQQSHIADPAAAASVTFTHSWNSSTDPTAAEGAALIADLGALKTAIDANNTAIDSINAALAATGITAAA
jgi:hypothetical protein